MKNIKYYFRGDDNVFDYLQKREGCSMKIISDTDSFIDVQDAHPLILHVGTIGNREGLDIEMHELLFFKFIPKNVEREIILVSFLPLDFLYERYSIYRYFGFVRLPGRLENIVLDRSAGMNTELLKTSQKKAFESWYLDHYFKEPSLNKKVKQNFYEREKDYRNRTKEE